MRASWTWSAYWDRLLGIGRKGGKPWQRTLFFCRTGRGRRRRYCSRPTSGGSTKRSILSDPDRQVAYYDDGVGTSSFKPLALLGGIFGFGLKRNVLDIYRFLCRNHNYKAGAPPEEIDRIYGFGFSRGSFTMRVVAGLVASQGLSTYGQDEAQLDRDARDAYRLYRNRFKTMSRIETPLRWLRDKVIRLWRSLWGIPQFDPKLQRRLEPHAIHFLGLWDTVAAYGGPLEEITRGIDFFVWPIVDAGPLPVRPDQAGLPRGGA